MLQSALSGKESIKLIRSFPVRNLITRKKTVRNNLTYRSRSTAVQSDNGSPSFAAGIFMGDANVDQLFPFPRVLNEDQMEFLESMIDPVDKFMMEQNDAIANDSLERLPLETQQGLKDLGVFGLQIPEDLDGIGLSNSQYARICEIIGNYDLGIGVTLAAHQSIGFKGILLSGTEEQKKKYLPSLATGEKIAAFCLTEPSSGSDAASIRTNAKLNEDGTHWILNGGKLWISNGGIADVFTVFAKTPVADEKTGEVKMKVTAFIVERDFGGITSGPPEKKMGIKCSNTTEVYFEDVKIPVENVLGGVGNGFKIAMHVLNNGRFGMAAILTGTQKALISQSVDHAANRTQFGQKIKTFGVIQDKIARMTVKAYVTESMAYAVCGLMDKGYEDFQIEAAMSKIYSSEASWSCADDAIQILGGMGYMKDCGTERVMRDLRIFRIFEGTNDILRLFIALTGLQSAGKVLRKLQKSISNPLSNMGLVVEQGILRSKRAAGINAGPDLSNILHPDLKAEAKILSKSIGQFAVTSEGLLMKYKKNIVEQQQICYRFADAAIEIFGMICVLSRTSSSLSASNPAASHEKIISQIYCQDASKKIEENLRACHDQAYLNVDKLKRTLSEQIVDNGGVMAAHPLGF